MPPNDPRELIGNALAGREVWLVGGALRDRALGRPTADLDLVVAGDARETARLLARAGRASSFPLSEEFGAWRVVARDGAWQIDVESLRGDSLAADLALRDFTVNAVAEPIAGGPAIDPLGGLADLAERRLRMAGPRAFIDDPLRVLRLVRVAVELDLQPDPETRLAARAQTAGLRSVSPERVFIELRRILAAPAAVAGLDLMDELGATEIVLPELQALRGVTQSRFHHREVHGHTIEVLEQTIALQADPASVLGEPHAEAVTTLLAEPLADGLTRGEALRWGALLHDAAKPATRAERPDDGRVTFIGHDVQGAELARAVLTRLKASERLRSHVAALVRHHLRLGFLVHEPQPLTRRTVFEYLSATQPVEVDVTLLSVADRLATRGDGAEQAIARHLRLAESLLEDALGWRENGPPAALWRGDELARALDIAPGPRLGEILQELARARYAGEIATATQALEHARAVLAQYPGA
jgi:poly(A) polymerase